MSNPRKNNRKTDGMLGRSNLLIIGWIAIAGIYGYIFSYADKSGEGNLPLMVIPMALGIIVQNRRLSSDWVSIQSKLTLALLFALLAFIPGKTESVYNLENHLILWPYAFIAAFVAISVFYHEKRTIVQLGEGDTLILTLSILYLLISRGWYKASSGLYQLLFFFAALITAYALIHAFSRILLSTKHRLALSILSSVIILFLSGDHLVRVTFVVNEEPSLSTSFLITALNYFLIGISLIYILKTLMMVEIYLPGRNRFYDEQHRKAILKVNKMHTARYARTQLSFKNAGIIFFAAIILFGMNLYFNLFPDNTAVWMLFWLMPIALEWADK